MTATWMLARSAVRGQRSGLAGTFTVGTLATALLTAAGAWIEAGMTGALADPMQARFLVSIASTFAGTAAVIAILVVATTFGAALRDRSGELALLRTLGATTQQIHRQTAAQAMLVLAAAALPGLVLGAVAARIVTPLLVASGLVSPGFSVRMPIVSSVLVVSVLALTALLAARLATRRALRGGPAESLRSSGHEEPRVGRSRGIVGICTAATGLLAAGAPFVVPGTLGSATAASSVLLLMIATACLGPVLVHQLARWAARRAARTRRAAPVLASVNGRGFSRKLSTGIVPLALLLALGTVQAGTDAGLLAAGAAQLQEGIQADLIVPVDTDLAAADREAIAATDGIGGVAETSTFPAEVRIERDEDLQALSLGSLLWEPALVRTLSGVGDGLLDPGVRAGSLAELSVPGTIAVSREVLAGSGNALGGAVDLRLSTGEQPLRIVAVYDRGLGFGDYLTGAATAAQLGAPIATTTTLVRVEPGAVPAVRERLAELGVDVLAPAAFAREVTAASSADQRLSSALTAVLLVFVALAALNTLAMLTGGRRDELRLLLRIGATRAQVRTMIGVEAAGVALLAVVIGTAAAVPGLIGVGVGLTGDATAALDLTAYGRLVLTVALTAVGTMVGAAWWGQRRGTARGSE